MRNLLTLTLVVTTFVSCKVDGPVCPGIAVNGEVLYSVNNGVKFNAVYNRLDSLGLQFLAMNAYVCNKLTTSSDADAIDSVLATKNYLTFGHSYYNSTLRLKISFANIDDADAQDWISTVNQHQLIEQPEASITWGIVGVPIGKEKHWVNELKKATNIFDGVQLNHYWCEDFVN